MNLIKRVSASFVSRQLTLDDAWGEAERLGLVSLDTTVFDRRYVARIVVDLPGGSSLLASGESDMTVGALLAAISDAKRYTEAGR